MRINSLKEDRKPLLMIIPMIDIIFFLLVFFMMSMLTMVTQKTIALNLPKAAIAKATSGSSSRHWASPSTGTVTGVFS